MSEQTDRIPQAAENEAEVAGMPVVDPVQALWRVRLGLAWRSFKTNAAMFAENKIGLLGLIVIIFFGLMALIHPILMNTVWDPNIYDPIVGYDLTQVQQPAPPSSAHLLGTDPLGRDVLSQLMFSTRAAFVLGVVAALVTVTIATTVGAVAAYFGGTVDVIFMRIADIIIMMPVVTTLLVLSAIMDIELWHLAIIIGILSGFGGTAIIIKSQALTVKVRAYIDAAKVAGGSNPHIIFRHIVPNLLPLSFLYMMFTVTNAIFSEAVLSFLGLLNIRMSWGLMINTTRSAGYMLDLQRWWLILPASLAITGMCAAFYLIGRAMDEIVNPRLRAR